MTDFRALCVELLDELVFRPVLLDRGLIDRARAALAKPADVPDALPVDFIDTEHSGINREMLAEFYTATFCEGGTADEITLRGINAVLARWGQPPAPPAEGEVAELVAWLHGQDGGLGRRAIYARIAELLERHAAPVPAETLAARPLIEQVAAMGDCIGQQTVGQIMSLASRAASWLAENPPGQPVAIEPRGCPTPGACSCLEPALAGPVAEPPAVAEGEVAELVAMLHDNAESEAEMGWDEHAARFRRAAELLERCAAPVPVPGVAHTRYEFSVCDETGMEVAGGSAPTYAQALSEGRHYLAQYQQDEPHTLELRRVDVLDPGALPLPTPQGGEVQS